MKIRYLAILVIVTYIVLELILYMHSNIQYYNSLTQGVSKPLFNELFCKFLFTVYISVLKG